MRLVGKIKDAHGLRGELYVLVFSRDISWLPKLKTFGLGVLPPEGQRPPENAVRATLTCQSAKEFKSGFILKAREVADRTAAEKLKGQGFYVPDEFFVSDEDDGSIYLAEIEGFTVELESGEKIGPIVGFADNGAQDLLIVKTAKGEVEIPFVEDFTVEVDPARQTVVMRLPEGLLDLHDPAEPDDE